MRGEAGSPATPPYTGSLRTDPVTEVRSPVNGSLEYLEYLDSAEYLEKVIESGPAGTSDGPRMCRVPGLNLWLPMYAVPGGLSMGAGTPSGPRMVADEFFLLYVSDWRVAMFSMPSMSRDCSETLSSERGDIALIRVGEESTEDGDPGYR